MWLPVRVLRTVLLFALKGASVGFLAGAMMFNVCGGVVLDEHFRSLLSGPTKLKWIGVGAVAGAVFGTLRCLIRS